MSGKTSDCCYVQCNGRDKDGYVPEGLNIGGGDYLEFRLCVDCGQVQGTFPVSQEALDQLSE